MRQRPATLDLTAGVLIGFGLSGCSFTICDRRFRQDVAAASGVRSPSAPAPPPARSGSFCIRRSPWLLMDQFGWQNGARQCLPASCMLVAAAVAWRWRRPATAPLRRRRHAAPQSLRHAWREAFGHRSYVLLVLGFFTCGFQLAFITVHLPSYLIDRGLSAEVGGWTLGDHRPVQHRRLGDFRLSRRPHAQALHALDHLFRAARWRLWRSSCCRATPRPDDDLRRRHRPAVALDGAAHLGAGGGDVRHALAGHAVRLCLFQPPGRRLPRRLARRLRVRPLLVPTIRCGGWRSCSA